jgi:hypothetical protein
MILAWNSHETKTGRLSTRAARIAIRIAHGAARCAGRPRATYAYFFGAGSSAFSVRTRVIDSMMIGFTGTFW